MAEKRRIKITRKLMAMELSNSDLCLMIDHNCSCIINNLVSHKTMIEICAYGMTYGAMRSKCPHCDKVLHFDGAKFSCLNGMSKIASCRYYQYQVKTAITPWEVPPGVQNQNLKMWKQRQCMENYEARSLLDEKITERNMVIKAIDKHRNFCKDKGFSEVFLDYPNNVYAPTPYSCFLVNNADLIKSGKSSYCVLQIFNKNSFGYCFYRKEHHFAEEDENMSMFAKSDDAVAAYESQFYILTGFSWRDWLNRSISLYQYDKRMIPLDIKFYSTLSFKDAEKIDDINEQLGVKLEYLKMLKIREESITVELIKKARAVTLSDINKAYFKLRMLELLDNNEQLKELKDSVWKYMEFLVGHEGKTMCLTKLRSTLRILSTLKRLLPLECGIPIRFADISVSRLVVKGLESILNVFYNYNNVKHIWPADVSQTYMMMETLKIIGKWIIPLFFETNNDNIHHHYESQDFEGCSWSVLLRKAERAFSPSNSELFIICTIDIEKDKGTKDNNQNSEDHIYYENLSFSEEITTLCKLDAVDYRRYGYMEYDGDRVKMHMLFPIKYFGSEAAIDLSNDEKETWREFINSFYSGGNFSVSSSDEIAKAYQVSTSKRVPYIYYEGVETKIRQALRPPAPQLPALGSRPSKRVRRT